MILSAHPRGAQNAMGWAFLCRCCRLMGHHIHPMTSLCPTLPVEQIHHTMFGEVQIHVPPTRGIPSCPYPTNTTANDHSLLLLTDLGPDAYIGTAAQHPSENDAGEADQQRDTQHRRGAPQSKCPKRSEPAMAEGTRILPIVGGGSRRLHLVSSIARELGAGIAGGRQKRPHTCVSASAR